MVKTKAKESKKADKPRRKRLTKRDKTLHYMRDHVPLMNVIRDLSPEQSEVLMPYIRPSAYDALCTCTFNALYNYKRLSEEDAKNLKVALASKQRNYEYLSDRMHATDKKQLKKREEIIAQSGSGFPAILAAVLPLLAQLITGV